MYKYENDGGHIKQNYTGDRSSAENSTVIKSVLFSKKKILTYTDRYMVTPDTLNRLQMHYSRKRVCMMHASCDLGEE